MLENAQSFVSFITSDSDWLALATFIISMVAVLLVSLVKLIISVSLKSKGLTFEKKKFELIFALSSFALAFGINFLFIWAHTEYALTDIAKQASEYAFNTSSIFLALNYGKKFAKGGANKIAYLWGKLKTKLADGKLSKKEIVEVIDEVADEANCNVVENFLKSLESK